MKGLTDIPGIRVGHVSDFEAITGCTAILCERRRGRAAWTCAGSASGTQEIDTLSPGHVTDQVHGILLAGGSAFGLEAASGVRRYLAAPQGGLRLRRASTSRSCPARFSSISASASPTCIPTRAMGEAAAAAATADAVTGRLRRRGHRRHRRQALRHGAGHEGGHRDRPRSRCRGGVLVAALVAVNAFGDVRDPATGKIVAGARKTREQPRIRR